MEQDYFTGEVLERAGRSFRKELPMLAKMKFRNQYFYWFIIHIGILLIGAFAVLTA